MTINLETDTMMCVRHFLVGGALLGLTVFPVPATGAPVDAAPISRSAPTPSDTPASIAALIKGINVTYSMFTLPNGLRVIVHSDRRAKVVTIGVDYLVGSRSEPPQRTGFAHLFEHLMFNGSENAPGDYSLPLQKLGAELNGLTMPDRTSYWETVPTPGLEQALFLESDRMGYLLGAVTQQKLDEQRSVVQNEKRQSDNRPLARVRYDLYETLYPTGHPDAHGVFGSMADLDAATLGDVKAWFRTHYGPNNAVLSLAGDIDVATARVLVEKYFGDIPSGPTSVTPPSEIPNLPERLDRTLRDRTATPRLYRSWAVPGSSDPAGRALEVAIDVMMRGDASYLQQELVEREKLFDSLSAEVDLSDHSGRITISGPLRVGVEPARAGARLDAVIAQTIGRGTTTRAISDYITSQVSLQIMQLASSRGALGVLGEGVRLGRGPDYYRQKYRDLTTLTPHSVQRTAAHWLGRPVYALTVLPGTPPPFELVATPAPRPAAVTAVPLVTPGARGGLPPVGAFSDITFPKVEHRRLTNGVEVIYLRGTDAPLTQIILDFDAGRVADPVDRQGLATMLLGLLDQGTTSRAAATIRQQRTRLGVTTTIDSDEDRTTVRLSVPSANLWPAVHLLADTIVNPAFDQAKIEKQRAAQLADIAAAELDGSGKLMQTFAKAIEANSPYFIHQTGATTGSVKAITRDDLVAFHHAWLRPDKMTVYLVSNEPLADILPAIERGFGSWRASGVPGVKPLPTAAHPAATGIFLIDQPGSDQSVIVAGQATMFATDDERIAAMLANTTLGGSFTSRLNTELRQRRGWSYGVQGRFETRALGTRYLVTAPVQQDRTGDTIQAIEMLIADFRTTKPLTADEFNLAVDSNVRALSVEFRDAGSYIEAVRDNRRLGRPEDDQATLATRYRALGRPTAQMALRNAIDPTTFAWVVLGDVTKIRTQLDLLGLPITVVAEPTPATGGGIGKPAP